MIGTKCTCMCLEGSGVHTRFVSQTKLGDI